MTWFKIDDSFYDHPKVFDAPDCAVALWTRAGTWSARNLTDGFVPTGMPARLCDDPDTAVKELVRRGLWLRDGRRLPIPRLGRRTSPPEGVRPKTSAPSGPRPAVRGGQAKAARAPAARLWMILWTAAWLWITPSTRISASTK
jgi:hypothetical protein